jgi:lysozyme
MKTGTEGLALIKSFEGWRAEAYRDAVGIWTIGYGHTAMAGSPKPVQGMKISKIVGEQLLKRDLVKYERAVNNAVTVDINQNQFDALVSFCYNVGPGNFRKSSVLSRTNQGRFDEVPARLLLWNKAGGKVLNGLTRRRKAEGILFAIPVEVKYDLMAVQQRLLCLGYFEVGMADGIYSNKTRSAVLAFRQEHDLALTPTIDIEFLDAIKSAHPRVIGEARATGKPASSRILTGARVVKTGTAIAGVGSALTQVQAGIEKAEGAQSMVERGLGLFGLMDYIAPWWPYIAAVLAAVVIVAAFKISSARVEDFRTGKTS